MNMKAKVLILTLLITKLCYAQDYKSLLKNNSMFKNLDTISNVFNNLKKTAFTVCLVYTT
jgi:hypothetical protein